ncbi:MAG TPA: outer membrane beta-barrel protein [Candidatus Kapabacteria bacterium]|nr:outer membrane beta-barrel protein [Candidatus Kapabacteria bacterium]
MLKKIIVTAFFGCICVGSTHAQILSTGDLFGPGAPPPMIGVELGLGSHIQQGTYQASCQCTFSGGSFSGFLGGLLFELPLDYEWTIGMGLKFDFKGLNNSTIVKDNTAIEVLAGSSDSVVYVNGLAYNRIGTVRETFFSIDPFVRYEFYRNGPFVQAGPGVGLVVASSFKHTRELLNTTVIDNNGNPIPNVHFSDGTTSETLENDTKISNINSLQLTIQAAVGYNIAVGDNAVVAPMLTYSLPITAVRPDILASGWKIQTIYFSAAFKYKID